ncbi:MAG: efflux RND transporter periplasmic adaptor subunit [Phormidesmis sp. RL_2_1]|nr:efflux RND transporter periplasmic adaptor subunit [Phormidesmis sp. RL_2_1]
MGLLLPLIAPLIAVSGCRFLPPSAAQPASGQRGRPEQADGPVAVKTARAESGSLAGALTYTGTTRPAQQVALRAQVSGEVIELRVDAGDAIARGEVIAQLDGDLQTTHVNQAKAELSARRAETAQAAVSISDAQAAVVQAQATFDQARLDAARLRQLASQGAISQQAAEAAELAATNAQQAVLSAQAQRDAQRQAVASAADRIEAQQAVLAQTQKQLSYADLRSPLTGVVLSRQVDIGDFVESGDTVLELGDLSLLEVTVQVSELDIRRLSLAQPAQVQLDAFPSEGAIAGQIERIAPVADVTSGLVPVQISIPNLSGKIGSGLLARVQFSTGGQARVVVPDSALSMGKKGTTVYVIEGEGDQAKAVARPVRTGDRTQDRIEILSGLQPNEMFVVESDRPLTSGQAVRLSILSEPGADQNAP